LEIKGDVIISQEFKTVFVHTGATSEHIAVAIVFLHDFFHCFFHYRMMENGAK
jgi:hypothetical protein